jgi:hypothetical protein
VQRPGMAAQRTPAVLVAVASERRSPCRPPCWRRDSVGPIGAVRRLCLVEPQGEVGPGNGNGLRTVVWGARSARERGRGRGRWADHCQARRAGRVPPDSLRAAFLRR